MPLNRFTVASPLNSSTLLEAGVTRGLAASAVKVRNDVSNDAKCSDLSPNCC